jgi:hypothetical protein
MVDGALLDLNELVLKVLQERLVNGKLALQGTIGDPAVLLQHRHRLAEDFVERHGGSSACEVAPQCAYTATYHTRTPRGRSGYPSRSANSALASCKSAVSKPSVNQPSIGVRISRASSRWPCCRHSRLRLVAARSS